MIRAAFTASRTSKWEAAMAHDDQRFPARNGANAFGTLAREVVSVLKTRQTSTTAHQARPHICGLLTRHLLTTGPFDPTEMLSELRTLRLSDAAIIDAYIPAVARIIGERWVRSELGFAEVTIASVRLQSLLTEVAFLDPEEEPPLDSAYDILIVACEGEQHTLGCFVAAAQLRRRGATVETMCGERDHLVRARILADEYDAVLFSCSRVQSLETISRIVIDTRERLASPPLFALGGIILSQNGNIKRLTGVDLVTSDVETVVEHCELRSARPSRQAQR